MPGGESWLGVTLKDVTAEQASSLKLNGVYGALVDHVEPDSPAAKAGLESGDVIVEFAGERVRSVAQLARLVRETPAGREVRMEVRRKGENKTLTATIEPRGNIMGPLMSRLHSNVFPETHLAPFNFAFSFGGPRLGVSVTPLTKQLGAYFGVKDGQGVLVREVEPGSAAEKAGVKAGDCIVKAGSTPIESADDLRQALESARNEKGNLTLTIVRNRQEQTLQVHLEAPPPPGPGVAVSDSARNGLPDAEALEAEVRALAPRAEAMASQAAQLRAQLESERGAIRQEVEAARAQAKAAQDQARALRQQMLDQKGDWRQQMNRLRQQLRALEDLNGIV